ncbi:MAG: c-type cytochrome [Thiotrichaceae bacterium]|nr:c-type cytochrome [Thiotrichaceae bacterium]
MIKHYLYLFFLGMSLLIFTAQADAPLDDELSQAMALEGNIEKGKEVFKLCIGCHNSNGWGLKDGTFPQLSGQHKSVIIKQLADIRAGNRDNPMMEVIAKESVMGGPQAIADVAAYIATLPMNPEPGHGEGGNDKRAEKLFYRKCAECHGADASGDAKRFFPRIQGQHYEYLLRQIIWMREGKRRNANPNMVKRIKKMKMKDLELLVDYVSRLKPPKDKIAPPDWKNPDFK